MAKVRKCGKCGQNTLVPISKNMEVVHSTTRYECSNCGFKVEIVPAASLGVQLTVYAALSAFLWFIFFTGSGPNGLFFVIGFWVAMAMLPAISLFSLWTNHINPEVHDSLPRNLNAPNEDLHILKRPINWIERRNMLVGLLAPVILIVVVIGLAIIVGFIKFTYFE